MCNIRRTGSNVKIAFVDVGDMAIVIKEDPSSDDEIKVTSPEQAEEHKTPLTRDIVDDFESSYNFPRNFKFYSLLSVGDFIVIFFFKGVPIFNTFVVTSFSNNDDNFRAQYPVALASQSARLNAIFADPVNRARRRYDMPRRDSMQCRWIDYFSQSPNSSRCKNQKYRGL